MDPEQCRQQIIVDFGEPALRDMAQMVGRTYPKVHREIYDRFPEFIARDHYPVERRAIIESEFYSLPNRHPHLRSVPASNKKDSAHYCRVSSNRSVLTQSKTEGPACLAREADFRLTLARSPQLVLNLFGDFSDVQNQAAEQEADAVYGLLAHGPDEQDESRLGFIRILIPDLSGKTVLESIDLMHFWAEGQGPAVFPLTPIAPIAPPEPVLKPALRPATKEDSGA